MMKWLFDFRHHHRQSSLCVIHSHNIPISDLNRFQCDWQSEKVVKCLTPIHSVFDVNVNHFHKQHPTKLRRQSARSNFLWFRDISGRFHIWESYSVADPLQIAILTMSSHSWESNDHLKSYSLRPSQLKCWFHESTNQFISQLIN
jgi:hypothetical protein